MVASFRYNRRTGWLTWELQCPVRLYLQTQKNHLVPYLERSQDGTRRERCTFHSFCRQNDFRDPEVPDYIYRRYICTDISIRSARQNAVLPSRTPFCPAERCSARQNDFRDPEVPDYIYRRYIYTEVTIRSVWQNAVLPGRTPFCPAEQFSRPGGARLYI